MTSFVLAARGPFSLTASTRFLEGFTPAAYTGTAEQPLEMAFPVEGTWQTAGMRVREHPSGAECEVVSLRPVAFWSPYEAAAWAVIGQRIRIRQAAAIKAALARQLGEPVSFGGHAVHAFPAPRRLADSAGVSGLPGRKPEWLRSVAAAALDGRLDASRLRAMPPEQALAELRQLPGIGDFSAELILLRGAAAPDEIPRHESRLARAVALAYNLPQPPSVREIERISDNWRPYRTWVTLLLRTFLEDQTHEIAASSGS